ncbi:MAG: DMT family transporter [Motilibacteraceae bacterium]
MPWAFAFGAIAAEIVATLALRAARGELRWGLIAVVVVGYALAFVLLGRALKTLNVGVVYAVWSGVGTAAVAVAGALLFGDRISKVGVVGLVITIIGLTVLSLSGSAEQG